MDINSRPDAPEDSRASSLHTLASVWEAIGNDSNDRFKPDEACAYWKKAIGNVEEAVRIRSKQLGERSHYNLAHSYQQLAELYKKVKEFPEALTSAQKAKEMFENHVADDHLGLKQVRKLLAKLEPEVSGKAN